MLFLSLHSVGLGASPATGLALSTPSTTAGLVGAAVTLGGTTKGLGGATMGLGGATTGLGGATTGLGGATMGLGGTTLGLGGGAMGLGGTTLGGAATGLGVTTQPVPTAGGFGFGTPAVKTVVTTAVPAGNIEEHYEIYHHSGILK